MSTTILKNKFKVISATIHVINLLFLRIGTKCLRDIFQPKQEPVKNGFQLGINFDSKVISLVSASEKVIILMGKYSGGGERHGNISYSKQ